jgi:hypothetical protein
MDPELESSSSAKRMASVRASDSGAVQFVLALGPAFEFASGAELAPAFSVLRLRMQYARKSKLKHLVSYHSTGNAVGCAQSSVPL